jgi:hypothetical protein
LVLPGVSVVSGQLSVVEEKKPRRAAKVRKELVVVNPRAISAGGLRFSTVVPSVIEEKVKPKEKKAKQRNDPRLVAAARELKDRWLEQVNGGMYLPMGNGKYEVSRLVQQQAEPTEDLPLLTAA